MVASHHRPLDRVREPNVQTCGFSRFNEDRFHISDTPCSGRPSGFDEDRLNTLIYNDAPQLTRELKNAMNCDNPTIVRHLHSMGKVQKSGVWA